MAKSSGVKITGTAQARESAAFEELELDALDQVVGGNGGSRGGGNPAPPNVSLGLQVSGSIGPFSLGGTLTSSGFYPSGGAGKGWGGGFSADVVAIIPTSGHTAADVLTGLSVDGSAHGGVGVTGSVGSDGIVLGAGVGAGVSVGASYTVDMHGPVAETLQNIQADQAAFALNNPGAPASFIANEQHNIQSAADAQAVDQGVRANYINQDDITNLGIPGAAAIVRSDDYLIGNSSALDDHGLHNANPDGTSPNDNPGVAHAQDYNTPMDQNYSDSGYDHSSSPGAAGDADNAGVQHAADPSAPVDTNYSSGGYDHSSSPGAAGDGSAQGAASAPSASASAPSGGDDGDHGFHNASPDGSTPSVGMDNGDPAAGGYSGGGGGGGGDGGGGGGGGGDGGGGGGDD